MSRSPRSAHHDVHIAVGCGCWSTSSRVPCRAVDDDGCWCARNSAQWPLGEVAGAQPSSLEVARHSPDGSVLPRCGRRSDGRGGRGATGPPRAFARGRLPHALLLTNSARALAVPRPLVLKRKLTSLPHSLPRTVATGSGARMEETDEEDECAFLGGFAFGDEMTELEPEQRPRRRPPCSRCGRPGGGCVCALLPPAADRVRSRTHVLVLQHPAEKKRALATARSAAAAPA